MRVVCLKSSESVYSCNAYLVLGDWNALSDVNTLIDIGTDGSIMQRLAGISTGVGKRPVEQVIFTHDHFDHTGGLAEVKTRFNPKVYAYSPFDGVDEVLADGQILRAGDRAMEVIHTPGHSSDSICLYCEDEDALFSGDTSLRIMSKGGSYCSEFEEALKKLTRRNIKTIYPGHDKPVQEKASDMVRTSLKYVRDSRR